jgi:hypothetical protein
MISVAPDIPESPQQGKKERTIFYALLKGLSHEIDFKNFDKILQNLAYLRDAAGF